MNTTDATVDVIRHMIRNACVNDGVTGSESRNVDVLRDLLEGPGLDLQIHEPVPGRASLVARIEGSDPTAPTLMLSGHTDVVPADQRSWTRDPFGGELVDGFVWGRGAVDMFNLTASMAVAFRSLADEGFRPRGTLVYAAVADEEAGGRHGARWLVEHQPDDVRADYVLTEYGGRRVGVDRAGICVGVCEKGPFWLTLDVSGTPGHGSGPYRSDNALAKASTIIQRLADRAPEPVVTDVWRRTVQGMGLPQDLQGALLDPRRVDDAIEELHATDPGLARWVHACTHTTVTPTVLHSGAKTNVIPDSARLSMDVRGLPGATEDSVLAFVDDLLGDLAGDVHVEFEQNHHASASPIDTPLWDALERTTKRLVPDSRLVPSMLPGFTDSDAYRQLGAVSYGYGLFSGRLSDQEVADMFHGRDERVDVDSLALLTEAWRQIAEDVVGT